MVFASGKVSQDALAKRDELGTPVAVAGWSSSTWPYEQVSAVLERYPNARELVWLQEEPENMGPGTS